jgi:hypothetical protein
LETRGLFPKLLNTTHSEHFPLREGQSSARNIIMSGQPNINIIYVKKRFSRVTPSEIDA